PPWLPETRPAHPLSVPAPPGPGRDPGEPGPRFDWRRISRSPPSAVGLAALGAALPLWPIAGFAGRRWLYGPAVAAVLRPAPLDGVRGRPRRAGCRPAPVAVRGVLVDPLADRARRAGRAAAAAARRPVAGLGPAARLPRRPDRADGEHRAVGVGPRGEHRRPAGRARAAAAVAGGGGRGGAVRGERDRVRPLPPPGPGRAGADPGPGG